MKIIRRVLEQIGTMARQNLPDECCGILLARSDCPDTVTEILAGQNVETQERKQQYILGHKEHIRAVEMEISGELRIVGYYHSHPHGIASPSIQDNNMAVPGMIYLITAIGEQWAETTAWQLQRKNLAQVTFVVKESTNEHTDKNKTLRHRSKITAL